MLEIPHRISLTTQIAASIRKGIGEGVWVEFLPGERRLCETFQASRPTIRAALGLLAREGLFEIRQGRRIRIQASANRQRRSAPRRTVGIIVNEPFSQLGPMLTQGLGEMRVHLAERKFSTEVYVCPARGSGIQNRGLESFVKQNRLSCCVLVSASRSVQRWFSDNSVPALVLGSCHPSVSLPSLDVDYRAVCRHAAGIFLGKGHTRMALVVPDFGMAGDIASEKGFLEAVDSRLGTPAYAHIVRHDGTARSIKAKLDALLGSGEPPTALLVARTNFVFAVIMHLLNRGIGVPGSISFIARDSDPIFESIDPPLAHYTFRSDTYIRQLCRLMLQMITQRPDPKATLIEPTFFAGRTVNPR